MAFTRFPWEKGDYVILQKRKGTDHLLREFLDGDLMGLPPKKESLPHHVRPAFKDISRGLTKRAGGKFAADLVVHGSRSIWANTYTQLVGKAPATFGLLRRPNEIDGWKLAPEFVALFKANLEGFHLEDFLVWLHAFSGFDDEVNSWTSLLNTFSKKYVYGGVIPSDYSAHFGLVAPLLPWPADIQTSRPTNAELQAALIPSEASASVEPTSMIVREDWQAILTELVALVGGRFVGLNGKEKSLAQQVIVGLATSKRVFLIGDPGTGKSEFAKLVEAAFRAHLGERLRSITTDVTDKTSETTLMGFPGLDGKWVQGRLTAEDGDGALLYPKEADGEQNQTDQVNLIVLNEANRRDVEDLLSLLQSSLDSNSRDPIDPSHAIHLGKSGVHLVSPDTYVVMTGNSPRDDAGRAPQSRPLRRRVALIWLPNPLAELLQNDSSKFPQACTDVWKKCGEDCLADDPQVFGKALESVDGLKALSELKSVLEIVHRHRAGLSFGLLRKLLLLTANNMALMNSSIGAALDMAVVDGVGPLLASAQSEADVSPRRALLQALGENPEVLTATRSWAEAMLGEANPFGVIDPAF
jgi:hypothetical protein